MITTIIFDLGEVYINGVPGLEDRLKPILGTDVKKIYKEIWGEDLASYFRGELTEDEYWAKAIKNNKWNTNAKTLKRVLRENIYEVKGTRAIMEALRAKGFKLGILSIHGKEWIAYCERVFKYHKLFDATEYSFEAGITKPKKEAYLRILKKLKAKPEACLFIDDNPKNLPPAEALGIKTILFKNANQVRKDLITFGIRI